MSQTLVADKAIGVSPKEPLLATKLYIPPLHSTTFAKTTHPGSGESSHPHLWTGRLGQDDSERMVGKLSPGRLDFT